MMTVAERARQCIEESGRTQADVAAHVQLSPSQFSKSLSGVREFSAVELARVAAEMGVSLHWLLTGEEDPLALRIAARHSFDPLTGGYHADGHAADEQILRDVALLYRQAYRR
jgi:transcriptional regulator with XRE-family HTH domain